MNMETNINNLMSLISLMGSPTAGLNAQPMMDKASAQSKDFENLLDLVEDMEIGDVQSTDFFENLSLGLNELNDREKDPIKVSANEADLSLMAMSFQSAPTGPILKVGQELPLEKAQFKAKASPETQSVNELLVAGTELGAMAELALARQDQLTHQGVDLESLSQWSAAMARGDVKAVGFEQDAVTQDKAIFAKDFLSDDLARSNPLHKEIVNSDSVLKSLDRLSTSHQDHKLDKKANPASANVVEQAPVETSRLELRTQKDEDQFGSEARQEKSKNLPTTGKELLLDRAHSPHSLSGAISLSTTALSARNDHGVLKNAHSLGENQDSRISPQSLDFVSDKVTALKAQGGGTLRIDLAPKEMGAIEIRVNIKQGVLHVEIKAEQLTTQSALEFSKTELAKRLEKVGPTQVEVKGLSSTSFGQFAKAEASSESFMTARPVAQTEAKSMGAMDSGLTKAGQVLESSSGLRLQNRDAVFTDVLKGDSSRFESARIENTAPTSKGESTAASDRGFAREERREKAMDRWEEIFGSHKRSA